MRLLAVLLAASLLVGCTRATPTPIASEVPREVTVILPQTVIVRETVEVRITVPISVAIAVPVTVVVTATPLPTPTMTATPQPTPTMTSAATTQVIPPSPSSVITQDSRRGEGPRGTLLYSVYDGSAWACRSYSFGTDQNGVAKEQCRLVGYSGNLKQTTYVGRMPDAGEFGVGVYVADSDLRDERLLVSFSSGMPFPSLSPDGNELAVGANDCGHVLSALDGHTLRDLCGQVHGFASVAWSPTDRWIAHDGCRFGDCGIWLTNADTGETHRLTTGANDRFPAWSPDAKYLVYCDMGDPAGNQIYRMNRDGSNRVRLAQGVMPAWSPDGNWIAFISDRSGSWAIYVMQPDGTDVRKVLDAKAERPTWR